MAKTPQQTTKRKRKRAHDDAVTAMPLRRSRRVAFRDPFRLTDLPPELRDIIYSMALRNEASRGLVGKTIALTGKLTAEARALSQVSRAVRAESMSIYYSENTFYAYLSEDWDTTGGLRALHWAKAVSRIERWSHVFGELVAPRLPSLHLCITCYRSMRYIYQNLNFGSVSFGFINFKEPLQPLTWTGNGVLGIEMTEASKIELEGFAVAVLGSQGKAVRTAATLRLLLLGLQVIMEQHSARKEEELPATTLLYLESRTELQKFLPHIQLPSVRVKIK
jgi:hypothetical protein